MADTRWTYDPETRTYRNVETGKVVTAARMVRLRDEFLAVQHTWAVDFAAALAAGTMTLATFEREMRVRIVRVFVAEYLFGRGGVSRILGSDRQVIGSLVQIQFGFLRAFTIDIGNATMSEAAIANRATLYWQSARQAYERGQATAAGVDLPAYPGDGSTRCKVRCRCKWDIREEDEQTVAYWRLRPAEHCADCLERSGVWNPYIPEGA